MILIDTNVIIDILSRDKNWFPRSKAAMVKHAERGLLVNDIVYAELAPGYATERALDEALAELELTFERVPKAALHIAGQAFSAYRKRGGIRSSLLPDFFIGAHARVAGIPILTRDIRRYQAYFDDVDLITP